MAEWSRHVCVFDEVEIGEDDGPLKAGMKVLIPCGICGDTPADYLGVLESEHEQAGKALLAAKPFMILFHWSPRARRKQILRYGLRPWCRPSAATCRAPFVCFGDSPSWAWALSAEMHWAPAGEWDLWQTTLDRLTDPVVLASEDRLSGIHEVRTEHRVFKRDLWHVGTRAKPSAQRRVR